MRDILIMLVFLYGLYRTVREAYWGILVWSWVGYMNAHKLAYGFSTSFPFAMITAAITVPLLFLSKDKKTIPTDPLFFSWVFFVFWMIVTTIFCLYPWEAWDQLDKVLKIQLFVGLTMIFINSRKRIDGLVWVIVISLGYYGIKGGLYTLSTGGGGRVWGPPGSFISDNNQIGLAMLVSMPLMYYLRQQSKNIWIRRGLLGTMVITVFSILGTQSRGCFLAGLTASAFLWLKSKNKGGLGFVLIVLLPIAFMFMPASWHERMGTIENYEEDSSAMGRINAWMMAFNLANSRFLGAGFGPWNGDAFARWAPDPNIIAAAHSIYFAILGEHGWVGLITFIMIAVMALIQAGKVIRYSLQYPELSWLKNFMSMVQVSLIAFLVGGSFYSLAYFDLYWHLISFVIIGRQLLIQHALAQSGSIRSFNRHTVWSALARGKS